MEMNSVKRSTVFLFTMLFSVLLLCLLTTGAQAAEVNGATGSAVSVTVVSAGDGIIDKTLGFYGAVPSGLMCRVSDDQHSILVTGFPTQTAEGSFTVNYTLNGYPNSEVVNFHIVFGTYTPQPVAPTPTPSTEAPKITQQPEDISVTLGGECSIRLNASGYSWCAWRFIDQYNTETVIFDKVGNLFPGLEITGGNSLTLTLKNIPRELNGWRAACLFGNDHNQTTLSEGAVIRVELPPTPTPEPTALPTAIPLPAVIQTATPIPLSEVQELPAVEDISPAAEESVVLPGDTPQQSERDNGGSRTAVIYVLTALAAALAIAWCVMLIRKGAHSEKPRWRK